MIRYLGIVNYLSDISRSDYIEKAYENLKDKFNIHQKLDLFKTQHINLSNGFFNKSFGKDKYVIMYNGSIYNIKEIKKDLYTKGYVFNTATSLKKEKVVPLENIDRYLEAEILLTCYNEYKENFLEHLNGAFSICIYDKTNNLILLSRDKIGIKPLYYTTNTLDNSFIFSTNIKDILNVPNMKAILDKQGALELIGIGPIHSPGFTYFKGIYELLPGHYAIYSDIGVVTHKYWDLETIECKDNETKCINDIYSLIKDSTKLQIMDNKKIGVTSPESINTSIILSITSKTSQTIQTFSYNNLNSNSSKKNEDLSYIKLINKNCNIYNYNITSNPKVLNSLIIPAMMARDMPGMAYNDSKALEFYSSIKDNGLDKCLSSLCSKEIFNMNTPFSLCLCTDIRNNLINKNIGNKQTLEEYIDMKYKETIKDVIHLDNDDENNINIRNNKYINIKWFISSLIERINCISSSINLEILLPYLDYQIIEYIYNLPTCINNENNNIINKIFNKIYPDVKVKPNNLSNNYDTDCINLLEHELKKILNDSDSKLLKIIDKDYILQIINLKVYNLSENKSDELISYKQILSYLIQIEYWINIYDIELEF